MVGRGRAAWEPREAKERAKVGAHSSGYQELSLNPVSKACHVTGGVGCLQLFLGQLNAIFIKRGKK